MLSYQGQLELGDINRLTAVLLIGICNPYATINRMLSYQGQLELGDINRLTAVRNCIHAGCSHNLLDFLKDLGFT